MITTAKLKIVSNEVTSVVIDSNVLPFTVPSEESFTDQGETNDFLAAPELERVCRELIDRHVEFAHLTSVNLIVLWKRTGGVSKHKPILARVQTAAGLLKYFAGTNYLIWMAADHAAELGQQGIVPRQTIEALLFHELCHLAWDPEQGKIMLIGHEFEGFLSELKVYGAWDLALKHAQRQFVQLGLFAEKFQSPD